MKFVLLVKVTEYGAKKFKERGPAALKKIKSLGFDPIWFGVILVVFIEMGQISPPIGINLFVIQGIWKGKLSDVVMGTIPFHLIMFVLLLLLVIFPDIALWLPSGAKLTP